MSAEANATQPLNEVQLMLLRLFSRPMSQKDMEAIRTMLMDYYDELLQMEVEKVIDQKSITRTKFEEVLNKHERTLQFPQM